MPVRSKSSGKGSGASGERAPRKRKKKNEAEPASRGLSPAEVASDRVPAALDSLQRAVEAAGGAAVGAYRDPVGGNWQLLAALPVNQVEATPFQRDISEAHVARLTDVIHKLDRFLDPIIAVAAPGGKFWTPNGHHRLAALRRLGAKSVVCLLLPDAEVAYRILALNTEKAHNLREKSLEVIRMARALAEDSTRPEADYALEFEEPAFLTLGICYEKRPRFSGGAYNPLLRRLESFLDRPLPTALREREERAARVFELDDAVAAAIAALRERGFQSPYLRAFVVARVNYLRFVKGDMPPFDAAIGKMIASATKFDAAKVKADQVAAASGPPEE